MFLNILALVLLIIICILPASSIGTITDHRVSSVMLLVGVLSANRLYGRTRPLLMHVSLVNFHKLPVAREPKNVAAVASSFTTTTPGREALATNPHRSQAEQLSQASVASTGPAETRHDLLPPSSLLRLQMPPLDRQHLLCADEMPFQALLTSWFMCGYHTGYYEVGFASPAVFVFS